MMESLKRLIAILFCFCITMITSCGNQNASSNTDSTTSTESTTESVTDQREEVTMEELANLMSNSAYTNNIKVDSENGITDPSKVGVVESDMDNILYEVLDDKDFSHIYNVSDYGILPSNQNNSSLLIDLLKTINQDSGNKKLYFPSGVYQFNSTVEFYGIKNLYVVGSENTEWLMTEWTGMIKIIECENFHINNINFDYKISPSISGEVISADSQNRTVTLKVNDSFDMTAYQYNNGKINYGNYMEYDLDQRTGEYVPTATGMLRYNSTGDKVNGITDGVYNHENKSLTLTFSTSQGAFKSPKVGTVVSVSYTMYEHFGIYVKSSKSLYLEGCNIYSTAGMAMALYSSENLYFNRVNLIRRDQTKLVTATADGLHTNDCYGDLVLTNSIFEGSHDDCINICTFYKNISHVDLVNKKLTLKSYSMEKNFPMNQGDEIVIFDESMQVVDSFTVESVINTGMSFEIEVDGSVRGLEEGYLVGNLTRNPKVVVDNCIFQNKRNRGILLQAQNATIKNCTFTNILHGAVVLHSAFDIFSEGLIPKNNSISNCKFIGNNMGNAQIGDIASFRYGGTLVEGTIKDITIKNNFFAYSSKNGVYLHSNANGLVENNTFYMCGVNNNYKSCVDLRLSSDINTANNLALLNSEVNDFTFVVKTEISNSNELNNIKNILG